MISGYCRDGGISESEKPGVAGDGREREGSDGAGSKRKILRAVALFQLLPRMGTPTLVRGFISPSLKQDWKSC